MENVNGVLVNITNGTMETDEITEYINHGKTQYPEREITEMKITLDGEFVDIEYKFKGVPPIQRIRRITGYLVGTTERWNNAKQHEERDRVKHTVLSQK